MMDGGLPVSIKEQSSADYADYADFFAKRNQPSCPKVNLRNLRM